MDGISLTEYREQIERAIEQGRYAQAVAHSKHILKQYPKQIAAYRLLGKAMLEANQDEHAVDMFRRVLSADPEDCISWVGMSDVQNRQGKLDAATWYLERAFELAPDNKVVIEELRHLYGRRDGVEPRQIQLTRAALARLYLRGDLLSRAVSELRALLAEQPERVDLKVALAEALWRSERRLEAAEVCQEILDVLPYCLKANLILGEIWISSGREEGQTYLRRAEALDLENQVAQGLFGAISPLPPQEARIVPLEYRPPAEEERPAWMAELEAVSTVEPSLAEPETALFDVSAAIEAQIEIPPWLEEVAGEEVAPPAPPLPVEPAAERAPEEEIPMPEEEVPEWLAGIREALGEEELGPITEEEIPEFLAELGLESATEEEIAERLAELGVQPIAEEEEEMPEWLAEAEIEAVGEEATPPSAPAELPADWLAGIREQFIEGVEAPEETAPPAEEEAPLPAWLEGEGMPSGDEALAWLEQLAAGKEEELQAQAEAEAEARLAEIIGRARPTEAPAVEEAPEETAAPAVEEPVTPVVEEPFGWTAFGEVAAPSEPVTAMEEPPPAEEEVPLPAWLEGEGMPSGDEALAWLEQLAAGKEEELQAQAEAEAEARLAEIMGRARPTEAPAVEEAPGEGVGVGECGSLEEAPPPLAAEEALPAVEEPLAELEAPYEPVAAAEEALPPEEAAPPEMPAPSYPEELEAPPVIDLLTAEEIPSPEGIPTPEIAPPAEEVHWGAGLAALPEEEAPPPAMIEEVPGVIEMEVPEPVEEVMEPSEVPAVEIPVEHLTAQRAHVKEHPRDYEAWLALARSLWQAGERQEALEAYSRVIRGGKLIESVIPDLEEHVQEWPSASVQRVLGDAYMKGGQLQEALDIYRKALEGL